MRQWNLIWIPGLIITALLISIPVALILRDEPKPVSDPWAYVPEDLPATDHSSLMTTEFTSGQEVTQACLACHEDAAHDVMATSHWTWLSDPVYDEERGELLVTGKANSLNNFCIGVQSNWTGCTRCHTGYGWSDANFDFSEPTNVDCLACHDQSGGYVKASAGLPAEGVDLLAAAQSVGLPTRENCGTCHFNGGGGNGVKHGDLDESLYFPSEDVDVHMGRYDFVCTDCHTTEDHNIAGRSLAVNIETTVNQVACTDCHSTDLHSDARITDHVDTVACQTCHIPAGARRDPTKMVWDWSTAGQDIEEDPHTYLRIKGSFVYEYNFMPEYFWYNGQVDRYIMGDPVNPDDITPLNMPLGDINDPNALLYPFKVHLASQIYDPVYNYLIQPQTVGAEGYWTTFDWDSAARNGMEAVGLPYSGEYGFTETSMHWLQTHMVAPKENALQCTDCHSDNGRIDWQALGYYGDPLVWGGRTPPSTGDN